MPVFTERKAGTYRAAYTGSKEKEVTNPQTGLAETRILWTFQEVGNSTTVGEMSKWTSTNISNKQANGYRMMRGILGRDPRDGDDTETYVGQVYDVQWGPNQAGNLTIIGVTPVADGAPADTAKAAEQHALQEGDELPF